MLGLLGTTTSREPHTLQHMYMPWSSLNFLWSSTLTATPPTQLVVFLALLTWLLGVCLLSFVPVAGRFPQAAALAGAVIANANAVVLSHLFGSRGTIAPLF
jgi:hypothetical protein